MASAAGESSGHRRRVGEHRLQLGARAFPASASRVEPRRGLGRLGRRLLEQPAQAQRVVRARQERVGGQVDAVGAACGRRWRGCSPTTPPAPAWCCAGRSASGRRRRACAAGSPTRQSGMMQHERHPVDRALRLGGADVRRRAAPARRGRCAGCVENAASRRRTSLRRRSVICFERDRLAVLDHADAREQHRQQREVARTGRAMRRRRAAPGRSWRWTCCRTSRRPSARPTRASSAAYCSSSSSVIGGFFTNGGGAIDFALSSISRCLGILFLLRQRSSASCMSVELVLLRQPLRLGIRARDALRFLALQQRRARPRADGVRRDAGELPFRQPLAPDVLVRGQQVPHARPAAAPASATCGTPACARAGAAGPSRTSRCCARPEAGGVSTKFASCRSLSPTRLSTRVVEVLQLRASRPAARRCAQARRRSSAAPQPASRSSALAVSTLSSANIDRPRRGRGRHC